MIIFKSLLLALIIHLCLSLTIGVIDVVKNNKEQDFMIDTIIISLLIGLFYYL